MKLQPATILRTAFVLSLGAMALLSSGCDHAVWGNGEAASEQRSFASFSAIVLNAGIDVELTVDGDAHVVPQRDRGTDAAATLRCDANLLRRIETVVEGDSLHVRTTDGHVDLRPRAGCELVVSSARLTAVTIEGPSSLVIHGTLDELHSIDVEGPAELDADELAADALAIDVEGPAELRLAGSIDRLDAELEGPVELDAAQLAARVVELRAEGPVDAGVRASERVVLDIEGPAEITVLGDPGVRELDVEGPAEVHFR